MSCSGLVVPCTACPAAIIVVRISVVSLQTRTVCFDAALLLPPLPQVPCFTFLPCDPWDWSHFDLSAIQSPENL